MLSECCSIRKNPSCYITHLIGVIILIYALWNHNLILIVLIIIIAIIGYSICCRKKPEDKAGKSKRKR